VTYLYGGCLWVLGFWEGDVNTLGLSVLLRACAQEETLRFESWPWTVLNYLYTFINTKSISAVHIC
jgi:hypothetical protein